MTLLFISGQEIIFIVLIVLLLFGSKSIPEMAKIFGQGMREVKKATSDIKKEFDTHTADIRNDINEVKQNIDKEVTKIKDAIEKPDNNPS